MSSIGNGPGVEPKVPHYYGDVVRILMLCGAGLMLISVPFSAVITEAFFGAVAAAIVTVAFAALTNPRKRLVIMGDVFICAAMTIVFELLSYESYQAGSSLGFIFLEAVGILFLVAFYFAVKTLRAMMLDQVDPFRGMRESGRNSPTQNALRQEESFHPE